MRMRFRVGGRGVGKRYEMAKHVANASRLKVETVMDLLDQGWQFTRRIDQPDRWERMR